MKKKRSDRVEEVEDFAKIVEERLLAVMHDFSLEYVGTLLDPILYMATARCMIQVLLESEMDPGYANLLLLTLAKDYRASYDYNHNQEKGDEI